MVTNKSEFKEKERVKVILTNNIFDLNRIFKLWEFCSKFYLNIFVLVFIYLAVRLIVFCN